MSEVLPPKQIVLAAIGSITTSVGSVIVAVVVVVHALESVMVQVYVPAQREEAVAVFCTGTVFHEYVYPTPIVPPLPAAVAVPSHTPLHEAGVVTGLAAVNKEGSLTVVLAVALHPHASVTVTVYVPMHNELQDAATPPDDQLYE